MNKEKTVKSLKEFQFLMLSFEKSLENGTEKEFLERLKFLVLNGDFTPNAYEAFKLLFNDITPKAEKRTVTVVSSDPCGRSSSSIRGGC